MGIVGIIANPASGKDIRRLVAHGSSFDNNEKVNIVRRVLLGLDALGVGEVHYLPDSYGIVPRAAQTLKLGLALREIEMLTMGDASDSREAARHLAARGAGCIVTLGGDGTNRVVVQGCGDIPLVPISTGTNNVFPTMIEGTLAGLAAALVATGSIPTDGVVQRLPQLDVWLGGELRDLALIDVVASRQTFIGARAMWEPAHLSEIVLSRVSPAEIGICGLGGLLFPDAAGSERGVHVAVGGDERHILAPLAPGLIHSVPIAAASLLEPGARIPLRDEPCIVALDGEREIELYRPGHGLEIAFNPHGPTSSTSPPLSAPEPSPVPSTTNPPPRPSIPSPRTRGAARRRLGEAHFYVLHSQFFILHPQLHPRPPTATVPHVSVRPHPHRTYPHPPTHRHTDTLTHERTTHRHA
ncbi:MAG: NAD(+)/NADH kinase [Chloroflexia bacterium]